MQAPVRWRPLGGGLQRLFGRHFLLGGEFAATGLFIFDRQFGPFDALPFGGELSLRILLGARF